VIACEGWGNPNADADVRLIAAAPDLLAACRLAARYLDPRHYSDAIREIDAAIAKATGQEGVPRG